MVPLATLRDRIRLGAVLFMTIFVGVATYAEFVYYPEASLYTVALWVVAVPILFATTVRGVRSHPLYRPLSYTGLLAIGVLQYLDGDWTVLAGLFVLGGGVGLAAELRKRTVSTPQR